MADAGGQPRTCAVIGANGFVGSAVAAEAGRRGFAVTNITRGTYELHRGTRFDLLVNANGNSKKFLSRENPGLDFELSVQSVHKAVHDFPAGLHIHLSTIDVYNDVTTPAGNREDVVIEPARLSAYGFHKFLAEQIVRRFAPAWIILRMGGFVGPGLRKNSIYDLLKARPLRVHPDSAYQYLHSRVLAGLVFDLADRVAPGTILNCVGDGVVSLRDIAGLIPGASLNAEPDAKSERYEVSNEALKAVLPVPASRAAVEGFIRDVLAGREVLS